MEESFKIYDSKPVALTDLEEINDWVEKSTNGHVTDFLSSIPPNLVMMLINAVHYKGNTVSSYIILHVQYFRIITHCSLEELWIVSI